MKREWFDPGPDGESPFVRKYNASPGTAGEAVSAAFRALLAGEDCGHTVDAKDAEIARLTAEVEAARQTIAMLRADLDTRNQLLNEKAAERDALRARIDAGDEILAKKNNAEIGRWCWLTDGQPQHASASSTPDPSRRQGMSEINHEAAKQFAVDRENEAHMPRTSNLARAYLDLHAQLAAERARVDALVWLVRLAFTTGRTFGMNCYELGEHSAFSFYESDVPKELAAILEGRTAHAAQGNEA